MLKGKSAVVTGSTSGIGLGIARALAKEGVNVMLNGFGDAAEIEKTRAGLAAEAGVKVLYDGADMSQGEAVAGFIKKAEDAFGGIDILINNAGIQFVSAVDEFPEAKWSAIQNIILNSTFHATKAALPGMKKRNWGRVINIVSAHGLVASPFKSAYVSAKHGQIGFTKSVALEVAETNITVNAICPGYVRTPLVEGQIDDQAKVHNMPRDKVIREVILASQPNKRFIEIEEVAALALFLCGEMAKSITGTAIAIDGGWTAR
ncbi:3-hydroxybutyrate dehydrogenase [uncultured Ferrovibrio sp.]|jgi:3-hydroxybutyrate dehydrogenase|uniref:3-hydroxybutyrate dehydrogenase n=1 Tax=uncultured Ferrovibrio sp. TaxID=1576913 RepID=UPI00262AA87F|nr:3-hydroxybutyrate dehydrogenase [uncultured Ferrovibrio sp.]